MTEISDNSSPRAEYERPQLVKISAVATSGKSYFFAETHISSPPPYTFGPS